jgi:hypothetical protein
MLNSASIKVPNFGEAPAPEVRRIYLLRASVNKVRRQGPDLPCCYLQLAFLSPRSLT